MEQILVESVGTERDKQQLKQGYFMPNRNMFVGRFECAMSLESHCFSYSVLTQLDPFMCNSLLIASHLVFRRLKEAESAITKYLLRRTGMSSKLTAMEKSPGSLDHVA